jgi:geranylgeranyl diphosphate synthase type II
MSSYKSLVESELSAAILKLNGPQKLKDAMKYSLEAGGKRIRPLLLFSAIDAFGNKPESGLSAACSLEMIHTYSLIHDDLPSMDDDDLRRGKPTNHKVFGEALAILAGDGLLTYSFQLIADDEKMNSDQKIRLISLLASSAGPEGMVGGQVADIQGENSKLDVTELEYIHMNKTGKLLTYSVIAGAIIGGADEQQLAHFKIFAHHLGLAFQISDDILDVEGEEEVLGKPVGSDLEKYKTTYPSLLSMKGAKQHLAQHIEAAKEALGKTDLPTIQLEKITDLIAVRDH